MAGKGLLSPGARGDFILPGLMMGARPPLSTLAFDTFNLTVGLIVLILAVRSCLSPTISVLEHPVIIVYHLGLTCIYSLFFICP